MVSRNGVSRNGAAASANGDRPVANGGRAAWVVKRGFDLGASIAMLVLLAPVWLAIALAITLDSRGPILFRQPRVGRDGEVFPMLKFRTMVDGAHERRSELHHLNEAGEGLFKISEDPRVTRVGRFLRATYLDELPQLLQVVTGKMSLVGPRPLVPEEDAKIQGASRRRLEARPGVTGAWQVEGAHRIPIEQMVKLDLDYLEDRSLRGDVGLLLRTARQVIGRHGE